MKDIIYFYLRILLLISSALCYAQDICDEQDFIKLSLREGRRDVSFSPPTGAPFLCDNLLDRANWLPFGFDNETVNNNYQLPEYCVDQFSCGTQYPIWLNGTHPTVNEIVDAVACISARYQGSDTCCDREIAIQIKKCQSGNGSSFYLYRFSAPPYCSSAYCSVVQTGGDPIDSVEPQATSAINSEDHESTTQNLFESENGSSDRCDRCKACSSQIGVYIAIAILSALLLLSGVVNCVLCLKNGRGMPNDLVDSKESNYCVGVNKEQYETAYQDAKTPTQNVYSTIGVDGKADSP